MQEVKGINSNFDSVSNGAFELFSTWISIEQTIPFLELDYSLFFSIGILPVSRKLNAYVCAHSEAGILYKSK